MNSEPSHSAIRDGGPFAKLQVDSAVRTREETRQHRAVEAKQEGRGFTRTRCFSTSTS